MRQFLKSGSVRGVRSNPHPYRDRPPWKSLSRRTKFSTANFGRTRSSHVCLSAMVPAFAEPDIHSLSDPLRIVTED